MATYKVTTEDGKSYKVTTEDGPSKPDWRQLIGTAAKESFGRPASFAKDLGTNPVTMARALPYAAGMAGAVSGIPMGTTMGTALGRGISDVALSGLKKPEYIPSGLQQGAEIAGAALGDVAAVPFMHKARLGKQIGQAEQAAGVMTRAAPKAITPGSVGETLNTLEAQIDAGTINTAQGAKDAKEIVDQIYMNPKIYEKSPGINVQSARVAKKVQGLMNSMIPGRGQAASQMATAMKVPNMIQRGWRAAPWPLKRVAQAAPAVLGIEEIMRFLHGR